MYHILAQKKPLMKDIDNFVVWRWASYWKQLGRQLNIEECLINNINYDYPNDCVRCCGQMLSNWLEQSSQPTWEKLIHALDKVLENAKGM